QQSMYGLVAGLALVAAVLIGLEYMHSATNLDARISLTERLQWLLLSVALAALAPWLVEVALSLNLAWTRAVGNMAGVLSFDAAFGELFTGEVSLGAIASSFAYAIARLSTLTLRVYLYITFLTRSWVVTILCMLAPLLGGALAMFPRLRPVVGAFWRHTLGEIFMQAIHGTILAAIFAMFARTHNVHPLLVFSIVFGYWAFTRAFHGMLFGPWAGIAQVAGLGSAAALVGLTVMAARQAGALKAGLAGIVGPGGRSGGVVPSPADVLGSVPGVVTASGGDAQPALGEHLRPPAQAQRVASWRAIGERVGRAVVGLHAAAAGVAIAMATGDHRLAHAVASAGTALGERIGAAIGGTVGGGAAIAPELVPGRHQSVRQFETALRSQMPDASPEQVHHTAVGLAGGMPAPVASTRQGILMGYARRGALIGYALGGPVGEMVGRRIGQRIGERALRSASYTPPDLPGHNLSAIASQMKRGDKLYVQISRDAAYVNWQGQDLMVSKGDPRLGPHETAVAVYEITETAPGVHTPVFRNAYRYNPDLSGYKADPSQGPYIGFGSGSGTNYWMDE
ncbi:MAG TPA: hypothetical protein VIK99_09615, partial [Thermaerobacter sp.]